ncbi:MAG: zinc ribbon domain-containing protein [Treponema sp.]|nr:zinc ribbon domain-containing protein [Treponema sp.]
MKANFRVIGKIGFLLAFIGFLMPMAAEFQDAATSHLSALGLVPARSSYNGFALAELASKYKEQGSSVLLYLFFMIELAGIIIGILLLMKKNVPVLVDWIVLIASILFVLIIQGMVRGEKRIELELASGFSVILIGLIGSLVCQIINQVKPSKQNSIRNSKKCPFCANNIKKEAIVCQFCGKDLPKEEKANINSDG